MEDHLELLVVRDVKEGNFHFMVVFNNKVLARGVDDYRSAAKASNAGLEMFAVIKQNFLPSTYEITMSIGNEKE